MTTQPILLTEAEVELLRKEVGKPSLMGKSIEANRKELEAFMRLPLDVPGHGEAGGYEHNRHKQNYTYMNLAGRLFLITQEEKYAQFVKDLLARVCREVPQSLISTYRKTLTQQVVFSTRSLMNTVG